jgi:arylsulfate sulfotransferase
MRASIVFTAGLVAATASLLIGCESPPPAATDSEDNTAPVITNAELANTNPRAPLAAVVTLSTDEAARLTIRIDDGQQTWDIVPDEEFKTEHSAMVLGMRFGRSHAVTVIAEDRAGNRSSSDPLSYETPPLPVELPRTRVTVREPERMEPGVNLFNVKWWGEDKREKDLGLIVIMDDRGDIIWAYRNDDDAIDDFRRLSNGNILYSNSPAGDLWRLVEINMLGDIVQRWHATGRHPEAIEGSTPVDVDSFHHEVIELPNGNFLALTSELRVMDDYPSSDTDPDAAPAPASVVGDVIVEFARDGTVIRRVKLLDVLDPHRIAYGSLGGGYYSGLYGDVDPPLRDWEHGNAVAYNPADDSFIVSLRHQDVLAKVSLATGDLIWLLGTPANWKEPWSSKLLQPVGEVEWSYHQHGVSFTGSGNIVQFDNGVPRVSPYEKQPAVEDLYSRAVEYAIDEAAMEVSQPWSYGGPGADGFYSRYLSDVDWLPVTGNILMTDGSRETGPDGRTSTAVDRKRWARIVELTHTDPAETVFEVILEEDPEYGVHIYRAKRLPSLYP